MSGTIHRRVGSSGRLAGDSDDEDDNDEVPLVRTRIESLEISREHEDASCWGNTWKSVASMLLTTMLLGPWIYSTYKSYAADSVVPDFLFDADQLRCAKALNVSFATLYSNIKLNRTSICRDDDPTIGLCRCDHPSIPLPKIWGGGPTMTELTDRWYKGLERNIKMAEEAASLNLDVVLLGDSITEHWLGTDLVLPKDYFKDIPGLWNSLFSGHALALGLSGDQSSQLLYRIQNGEMPESLNPKAWWILIGTNDYMSGCSKESILMGTLTILEEAFRRKPAAKFIVQGLLPRGEMPLEQARLWKDFTWIQDRLACMVEAVPQASFYNGTSLFLTDDGSHVDGNLMHDYLHPYLEGYKIFGPAIIQYLKEIKVWSSTR